MFNVGNLVTRNSYDNDTLFKITSIKGNIAILKGVEVRLIVDSQLNDLKIYDVEIKNKETLERDEEIDINDFLPSDRSTYFYIPGKILHIDGDTEYLNRCLKFYKKSNVSATGLCMKETDLEENIIKELETHKPDILVITGHDFLYKFSNSGDISNYKNSLNFVKGVRQARNYERSQDKLIIIAGACQSDYEELIKNGANFASSPKRVNIHALDPAIIACLVSLSEKNEDIDLIGIINKTKYKDKGIGGIKTRGTMYVGYPK
ncbi:MAG: sporulation peptidase YabG [Bacilli bacterium]